MTRFDAHLQYLDVGAYHGADDLQRNVMAPSAPAVYIWVFDFVSLIGLSTRLIDEALARFTDQQGRRLSPKVDNFLTGTFRTFRPELKPRRRAQIISEISRGSELGTTIAHLATIQQRPYYCGITINFARRISEHLAPDSDLQSQLTDIRLKECAVLWTPIEGTFADRQEEQPEGLSEWEYGAEPDLNLDDADQIARFSALTAVESLLIRTSMPLMNERLDS